MSQPSVVVENLGKKFGLTLKTSLKYGLMDSARRMIGGHPDPALREGEFWALRGINFTLQPGDALGIMGVNGSGKTTLLRILNGTYSPDTGSAILRGRIGALIAAGAGFSPMLTGRENIHISAALLGLSPAAIRKHFDEIVDFAGLGEFIDMPVRNYSSGMSVRLGFAIAAVAAPEILLVDEVLAVGDISFQKKCFERIQAMKQNGTTILFVSHAPGAVWAVCNKAILIDAGRSAGVMSVEDTCRAYDDATMRHQSKHNNGGAINVGGTGDVTMSRIEILNIAHEPITEIIAGESFIVRQYIVAQRKLQNVIFRMQINGEIHKALCVLDSYEIHQKLYDVPSGESVVDIHVTTPNLRPGIFTLGPSILQKDAALHLYYNVRGATLAVRQPQDRFFYADPMASVYLNAAFSCKE